MLAFLTSAPVQDAPLSDRLYVPDNLPPVDDAVKLALRTRPDAQATEAAVEAARQGVQSAIGQYYPSVSIDVNYFLHKDSVPTIAEWTSVISANIPIFTAGLIHANVRTAWSQLRQAWLNEQRAHRQVAEQVRMAYENLEGSRMRIVELRTEVAAARDALQQAQFSYQAGLATNLDVLTATDQLLLAQLSLATERLNFKLFYLQLLRAEGRMPRPDSAEPSAAAPLPSQARKNSTTPNFARPVAPATGPARAP